MAENTSQRKAEHLLADAGVFKGHDGLRGLAESTAFWERQEYGTRLYYGDGATDYLHRGVLWCAVNALDTAASDIDDLRRQLAQRDARIAELEAKLQEAARLARDSAERAGELVPGHGRPRRCDVSEPKFGDHVEGVYASAGNPQKFGTFVEVIRRAGRMNPGTFYRLTNEHGDFWEYPAGSCAILDRRSPSASDRAVERIKAWASPFVTCDCACCETCAADVLDIISEEAERGNQG